MFTTRRCTLRSQGNLLTRTVHCGTGGPLGIAHGLAVVDPMTGRPVITARLARS